MKLKINKLLVVVCVICSISLNAQNSDTTVIKKPELRKNSVYFEVLGNAALYSFNYDHLFSIGERKSLVLRAGVSALDGLIILGELDYLIGGPKHFFDPGLGMTFFNTETYLIIRGGYRLHGENGFLFRISVLYNGSGPNLQYSYYISHIWLGVSLGYSF